MPRERTMSGGRHPGRTTTNIVLIGMPGAGKSTVGALLAERMSLTFLDTDLLVGAEADSTLQEIVDREGYQALRKREEEAVLSLDCRDRVIATGGSAVYSRRAMEHLRRDGTIVFLRVSFRTLAARLTDAATRGLAKRPDQDLADLYAERADLYRSYADITVDCDGLEPAAICDHILRLL